MDRGIEMSLTTTVYLSLKSILQGRVPHATLLFVINFELPPLDRVYLSEF